MLLVLWSSSSGRGVGTTGPHCTTRGALTLNFGPHRALGGAYPSFVASLQRRLRHASDQRLPSGRRGGTRSTRFGRLQELRPAPGALRDSTGPVAEAGVDICWKAVPNNRSIVKAPSGVVGVPKKGVCFGVRPHCGMLCLFLIFCEFNINHCVCRRTRNLADRQHTVRRETCCLSRASGVVVVVSGPSMVSVVFRLVRSWSFCCSSGFLVASVCRTFLVG